MTPNLPLRRSPRLIETRHLRPGDWIVCPSSNRVEKVTRSERRGGRWFIRTNYHDHNRLADALVELAR